MSDRLIEDLQADIAARIRADEVLGQFPVITERAGDPVAEVAQALGVVSGAEHRRGLALVILQITGRPESIEIPDPPLILQPRIRVVEAPILNSTGTTALSLARRVLRILHHYQPAGLASCLVADSPAIIPTEDPIAPLAYDVGLRCMEGDPEAWLKCCPPTIWPDEGVASTTDPVTVSLACDTEGAEIRYTTDGSPPYRGNPAASVYTAPFTVDGETTVRASAWLTGLIASDTVSVRYSEPSTT